MRETITFIGNGNMALSMAMSLKESYDIEVAGRNSEKLDAFEKNLNIAIVKNSINNFDITNKTVILCVKPANIVDMKTVLKGKAKTLYSVLAGTSLELLKKNIKATSYARAMPNLAATVGKSMTTLTGDFTCKTETEELFSAIGSTLWLGSEKELDIATALAGSGPAYLALVAEALADGAVKQGLKRDDAMTLMRGLFDGFGSLIQNTHPALLKDDVMSPGGTTAAGYGALEQHSVRQGFIAAIESAYSRAIPRDSL
ncbi:MAG: pyrroline-5-carboxylate reductase [Campylobacterota bacterium]|nr:pyrroline-5-carboxylate reductase [Campylobacterota bacterium]